MITGMNSRSFLSVLGYSAAVTAIIPDISVPFSPTSTEVQVMFKAIKIIPPISRHMYRIPLQMYKGGSFSKYKV